MNKIFIFETIKSFTFDLFAHTKRSLPNKFKVELVSKFAAQTNVKLLIIIFVGFLCSFFSSRLWAASAGRAVKEGNRSFKEGQFDEAIKNYEEVLKRDPESDIGNFNKGAALYKQERYKESVEHTQKALLSENKEIQRKAQYNLGNTFYQWGMSEENKDVSSAIKKVEQSLSHYEKALDIGKDDQDTQWNYEFVKKELERLKKKENQAEQNQQKPGESASQNQENSPREDNAKEDNLEQKFSEGGAKEGQEDYNKSSGTVSQNTKELTQQEADMLLKDYEATEEPKGLFRTFRSQGDLKDVEKDW